MADWGQIGEMLQGVGAGFSGNGPQYQQAKALQDEATFLKDERRRQALIQDFSTAYQLGAQGNWESADRFLMNREEHIGRLGGDTYHTSGLRKMIQDPAQREEALKELEPYAISFAQMQQTRDTAPQQFGATFMAKDQAGNMFQGTQVRNPNTGQVETAMSPVGHSSPQQGQLSMVGQMGMTQGDAVNYAGDKAAAAQAAQYQYAAPIAGAQAQARANVEAATAPPIATAVTEATERAKVGIDREAKAPTAIAMGEKLVGLLDMAIKHPGREEATGKSSVLNPVAVPGSERKDYLVLAQQLKGSGFLEAYQQLKGGGAITAIEGEKAEQAQNRLNEAQSEPEYLKALKEMRDMTSAGIARTKNLSGIEDSPKRRKGDTQAISGFKVIGVK